MKKQACTLMILAALAVMLSGCFEPGTIETPPEENDLVEPFTNPVTGYYSNLALEMEGIFEGQAVLDLSDMSESERQNYIDNIRNSNWRARDVIDSHRKFSKKQLNTEKLHMNLSNSDLESYEVIRQGNIVRLTYSTRNEILIMRDDLEEAGIDPDSFTSKVYPVKLPADHRNLKTRVGIACAEGYDSEEDLNDSNYFYYFNPDKPGCEIDASAATFTLNSLLPEKNTYPEYDRLTADNKVTVAVFFGAAGHEDPPDYWDWGCREYRDFVRDLQNRGFSFIENLDPKGKRYKRTRSGIQEIVDVVSPEDLSALNHDTDGIFKQALQTHEVIAYLGHSFYGSLNVLRDSDAYPANTYQIIFMNSCWSYEYYTKQVFEKKVTPRDPTGWELADVVNNTEVSWFHHNADESRILLTNLFMGCETGGADGNRRYDWDGIIKAMNKYALDDWWDREKEHEIYGVSGVTSNCYDPREPNRCDCSDECPSHGATECVGNAVRTCGHHDVDHCTEWGQAVPCKDDETCMGGQCHKNCVDDGYEENDAPEFAVSISRDQEIELMSCPGDQDWYSLGLQAGDILNVDALFAHDLGDLDMHLYAEGDYANPLARSESRTDNEHLAYQVENAGTYYLMVIGSRGGQNSYRMKATVGSVNCEDECSQAGEKRCQGDGYQVCAADHDGDDCLEWSPVVSCNGLFCVNGECVEDCTDDMEPNDSMADAAELSPGSLGGLRICPQDQDWYKIELEAGASMQIEITFTHADGDLDMSLHDSESNSLASSTSTNDREEVSHAASERGTFFLKVYGYSGAQNSYAINLTVEGAGPCVDECAQGSRRCQGDGYQLCGDHDADECLEWGEVVSCEGLECQDGYCVDPGSCTDDAYEDNDDSARASSLSAGSYQSLQICANDDDWYGVELEAGDVLMATIAFSNPDGDLDFELYDSAGTRLDSSLSTSDQESVAHGAAAAGTYHLRVYGYSGAENSYSMDLQIEDSSNPGCSDDQYENNDTQDTATALSLTVGPNSFNHLKVCTDDDDWYALSLHAGETVQVDLGFTHADGDIDVKLLDANQNVLATGYSTSDNESVEHQVTEDGTFYLQVYGWSGAENSYDMAITIN